MKTSLLPHRHLRLTGSRILASRATTLPYWCLIAVKHHRQWHLQSCYIHPDQGRVQCTPRPVRIGREVRWMPRDARYPSMDAICIENNMIYKRCGR